MIDPNSVLDISHDMDAQGRLNWQAPAGTWTVLRIGHTTTGRANSPAPDGGSGLECDKFSREACDYHFDHFFGSLFEALGPLAEKGLAEAVIDSYEKGFQNWTPQFPQEFLKSRGYDLKKYMPAMLGRVVGGPEISERFLWDVRLVQADLMADNYYGRFAELCRQHNMKSYVEPYSGGPFDEMQIASQVDIPVVEYPMAGGANYQRFVDDFVNDGTPEAVLFRVLLVVNPFELFEVFLDASIGI